MESIWMGAELPRFSSLRGNVRTDVLIIGGGMAGVLCARFLREAGVECLLAEADTIGSGITKDTTAKITAQHGLVFDKLLHRFGADRARMYLDANLAAVEEFRRLCHGVDCDFQDQDNFIYSLDDPGKLERELLALELLGYRAEFAQDLPLPFGTAGAVKFPDQAQFHPLKFLGAVAKDLPIYERTPIREMGDHWASTDHGRITFQKAIVATHFPFLNKHGSYFLKLYQHRSYVLALKNVPEFSGMYLDERKDGLSFRCYGGRVLLGGGSHRTGKQGGGWNELEHFAETHYPGVETVAAWATQDCMSLDGVPYIGPYSAWTQDLYVATGFNKWGMTSSMVSAMVLTDLITGRENPYAPVFSPSRSILRPQLAVNGFEAVKNLCTFTTKRCPHMGCALKWNPQERTWDCPCHGSRFEEDGKLIDNPATGDLKKQD